jgi:hypothetical protein
MILTAHQPVYLPWLGLFHKIALADKFCFFDDVQYQPKDWNNRNKVKFNNGTANWLTVPVLRKSYLDLSYLEIKINNSIPWQRKQWRSIELNYSKAPYFNLYAKELRKFYEVNWEYLCDLNYEMLLFFLDVLNISIPIVRMKEYSFRGEKGDFVIDMCLQLGADIYIFGEQGKNYADVEAFKTAGVFPVFQKYQHPVYHQLHGDFISHLSIVDLLFNCGQESLEILMSDNLSKGDIYAESKEL